MNELGQWCTVHSSMLWMILVGAIVNSACGLLGCYLVLRRLSLMGDAISHSVLPGIVLAFLLAGQLSPLAMLAGAAVMGLITAWASQTLQSFGRVPEDSSMGIVFTSLFALGVFLLTNLARNVDLDPGCVLYGQIEYVSFKTIAIFGFQAPHILVTLVPALVAVVAFILLCWKELKISAFDPALATALGIPATLMHYLLMAMVAIVTVASFEAVGSVIVVAMLIVPAATAHLLTDRLGWMMFLSVVVGIASSVIGICLPATSQTTAAGMMGVTVGGLFAGAVVFAPRYGLVSKWAHQLSLSIRIAEEDIVALLYRAEELSTSPRAQRAVLTRRKAVQAIGGGATAWLAVPRLFRHGQVHSFQGALLLTERGRRLAQSLVRSHRLWEAYLLEHFQLPLDHIHAPAERIEHFIGPELQKVLAAELHTPLRDPHGREIPPSSDG